LGTGVRNDAKIKRRWLPEWAPQNARPKFTDIAKLVGNVILTIHADENIVRFREGNLVGWRIGICGPGRNCLLVGFRYTVCR